MSKLIIRQLGGSDIAEVQQDSNGHFTLQTLVQEFDSELRAMLTRLSANPLPLRTGREIETPHGPAHQTIVRHVAPADPDFLAAMAAALDKEKIGGQRVRGIVLKS